MFKKSQDHLKEMILNYLDKYIDYYLHQKELLPRGY